MFRALRNGEMRDIIVDATAKDVQIPTERFFETIRMMKYIDIQEGAMEAYTKKNAPYIDDNGEAVITKDIEALVKGLIQRCSMHNISPLSVLYYAFVSIGDPRSIMNLRYLNTNVDPTQFRKPKMLEFEQAVRYLGLPHCIEAVRYGEFVSCDSATPIAAPTGAHYAIMCKPDTLNRLHYMPDGYMRMEFIVPCTDELKAYLPDMENRYYAYKDGEDSGWRL